mmetsp:Transcript_20401/g.60702  ORF Transcript_20401/g.60702 Transcript_20401/m.60702 type:complete len:263 (+) Transcript_20401:737-1525(+)
MERCVQMLRRLREAPQLGVCACQLKVRLRQQHRRTAHRVRIGGVHLGQPQHLLTSAHHVPVSASLRQPQRMMRLGDRLCHRRLRLQLAQLRAEKFSQRLRPAQCAGAYTAAADQLAAAATTTAPTAKLQDIAATAAAAAAKLQRVATAIATDTATADAAATAMWGAAAPVPCACATAPCTAAAAADDWHAATHIPQARATVALSDAEEGAGAASAARQGVVLAIVAQRGAPQLVKHCQLNHRHSRFVVLEPIRRRRRRLVWR